LELTRRTSQNTIAPKGFDKELLWEYTAYKNEMRTKQLVWATLLLALSSIILSTVTLILR
jgi:hypothetical protein